MTKKELIVMLDNYPDDIEIIMSVDAEGNQYKKLANDVGHYLYEDNIHHAWLVETTTDLSMGKPCVCLFPIN